MKLFFRLSLRGRLLLLILAAFAVIAAMIAQHSISHGAEKVANASTHLRHEAQLIAAEQQIMVKQANLVLNALINRDDLNSGITPEACRQAFEKLAGLTQKFKRIAMMLPNGDLLCTSIPTSSRVSAVDRPWFQQALKSEEMVVSDMTISRIDGSNIIMFAKAKRDAGKKVSLVFGVVLDLDWLNQQLAQSEHVPGARLVVLDGNGDVVACHPREEDDWQCKSAAQQPLFQAVLASGGKGMIEDLELYGARRTAVFEPLLDTVSGPMFLALSLPEAELRAPIKRELIMWLSIVAALLVLLMALVYWGGERLLVRPIKKLSLAVDRFGKGEHTVRSGLSLGNDDISQLAEAFDGMAEAVQVGEQDLERAVRALKTLSGVNGTLVHASDEAQLLQDVCQIIVEQGGYSMAWVAYCDNPEEPITPMASFGIEEDVLADLKLTCANMDRDRLPILHAICKGETRVTHDVQNDPKYAVWKDLTKTQGYASSFVFPLKIADKIIGALSIYAAETDAFDEKETALLTELGGDLAFGIETIRTRSERDRISEQNQRHAETLRQTLEDALDAIATTVEMRDPYTAGHQRRVAELAVAIAQEMGLDEDQIHGIRLAASVHDLGKIRVPAEILVNPGKLNDAEFTLVKMHPEVGHEILKDVEFPWPIADIIWQHHERLDGSGYPQGLKDEQIILEARIVAVADVVEAMSSHRPYRAGLGIDVALAEIERGKGSAYDPAVADACLKLFSEERFSFQK